MFKTIIAIDYGKKRIGVASGQMITKTANPVATVNTYNTGEVDWETMDKIINRWKPGDIVIGLPLDARGFETDITKATREFFKIIKERYNLPTHFINEAFSTRAARWKLEEVKSKKINHLKVDAMAACIILETWMNEN